MQSSRARSLASVGSRAGEQSMHSEQASWGPREKAVQRLVGSGCGIPTCAGAATAAHRRLSSSLAACCLAASSAEMYCASRAAFLLSSTLASISFWSGSGT